MRTVLPVAKPGKVAMLGSVLASMSRAMNAFLIGNRPR